MLINAYAAVIDSVRGNTPTNSCGKSIDSLAVWPGATSIIRRQSFGRTTEQSLDNLIMRPASRAFACLSPAEYGSLRDRIIIHRALVAPDHVRKSRGAAIPIVHRLLAPAFSALPHVLPLPPGPPQLITVLVLPAPMLPDTTVMICGESCTSRRRNPSAWSSVGLAKMNSVAIQVNRTPL